MSDTQRVSRPTAPPPERGTGNLLFFDLHGRDGVFYFEPEDGAAKLATRFVMGYLEQLWAEWDPGRDAPRAQDRIEPRWKLRAILSEVESDGGRRTPTAWITIGPKSAFFGAAHGLLKCAKGDFIGFKAVPGDNGTFVNVDKWDGSAWSAMLTPKGDGREFGSRYDEAAELLKGHPDYKPYEKKSQDGGQAQTHAAPAPQQAVPVQTPTETSVAHPGQPPADAQAFGFNPGRWPLDADWSVDPTAGALIALRKKAVEKEIFPDAGDGMATFTNIGAIGSAIAGAYGLPRSAMLSKGRAMLAYDFLAYASPVEILRLKDAVVPAGNVPKADEYDPFADE